MTGAGFPKKKKKKNHIWRTSAFDAKLEPAGSRSLVALKRGYYMWSPKVFYSLQYKTVNQLLLRRWVVLPSWSLLSSRLGYVVGSVEQVKVNRIITKLASMKNRKDLSNKFAVIIF